MSSDREFFININDIIGKAWLASLDDSEGYVLSLKLIEHNSVAAPSPEEEQEETLTVTEITLPRVIEKPKHKRLPLIYEETKSSLYKYLLAHFKNEKTTFQSFVKEVNHKTAHLNISYIRYEDLKSNIKSNNINETKRENSLISGKIKDLIWKLADENQLPLLRDIFENFKNST